MITILRQTKSTDFKKPVKSMTTVLQVWKTRRQNGAIISHIQIGTTEHWTYGNFVLETEFYRYFVKYQSGRKMVDFLRKHEIANMTEILQATDEDTRKAIYMYLAKREVEREKRKARYAEDKKFSKKGRKG
jgi:hypothetical protein